MLQRRVEGLARRRGRGADTRAPFGARRSPCSRATRTRSAFDVAARRARSTRVAAASCARCTKSPRCKRGAPRFRHGRSRRAARDGDRHDQAASARRSRSRPPAPTCSSSDAQSPRPTIRARVAETRARGSRTRRDRGLARRSCACKPAPSCVGGAGSLCWPAVAPRMLAHTIADTRACRHAQQTQSSLSQSVPSVESQVPHGGVRYGEPALAHTGATSARTREGRRRAPPARRGEGQAEDRLAVARGAVRRKPTAATRAATMLAKLKSSACSSRCRVSAR